MTVSASAAATSGASTSACSTGCSTGAAAVVDRVEASVLMGGERRTDEPGGLTGGKGRGLSRGVDSLDAFLSLGFSNNDTKHYTHMSKRVRTVMLEKNHRIVKYAKHKNHITRSQ